MDSEAQAMPASEQPNENHQWLMQLVGDWEYTGEASMGPGQESLKSKGRESVRSLGGIWIVGDGVTTLPDGDEMLSIITLGFDTRKGRFVGSWVASCMNGLWVYDGELDSARKVLTLNCIGPAFSDPTQSANYQDIIELVSPDKRLLRSQVQGEDGSWTQFMSAEYRRI